MKWILVCFVSWRKLTLADPTKLEKIRWVRSFQWQDTACIDKMQKDSMSCNKAEKTGKLYYTGNGSELDLSKWEERIF